MYFELSNLENKCTLDYSIWNGETITLNHEFEGGRGYSDDAEVCGKILVAATRRCDVVKRKMERRREWEREEGKWVRWGY